LQNKPPIIALRDACLVIGDKTLFSRANVALTHGDRICLVGRNGSGKSTLLKVLAGEREVDKGERFVQPGSKIGYLPQDPIIPIGHNVWDYVSEALSEEEKSQGHEYKVDAILLSLN
jgi:ATP-binding cassette subfamily F protein uup